MNKFVLLTFLLIIIVPSTALCQEETQISDRKLEPVAYLIGGVWRAEGVISGFGNFTAERTYNWVLGGKFVEQRHIMKLPNAEMETRGIIGWHADKEAIAAWGFGSDGGFAETFVTAATKDEFQMEGTRVGDFNSGSIRSTFRKVSDHEFLEIAEIKKDREWVEMFTFEFTRTAEQ